MSTLNIASFSVCISVRNVVICVHPGAVGDEVAISLVKDSECFETNDLPNGLHMVTVVQGRHSKPVRFYAIVLLTFYFLFICV